MKAALLLDHYERIADAPDAIARLRRFVLDLAVRGKLVEHESGVEFRNFPDAPYSIPSNWRWRRIGDELELLNGMAFKPSDWVTQGLPIVRIQNLNNPFAPFNHCNPAMARDRSLIDDGAFLISWSGTPGTSFGAFIWRRGKAVLNQHIFRCDFKTTNFDPAFLRLAINGRLDEMIAKAHGGVGLQHITKGKLEAMQIVLPPLPEQHRIVAKVEELMALCDQLEAARADREAARDRFALSTLAKLNTPDPESFGDDARFTLANLAPLTTRADQIKQLRQTILNLAVRGKLVEQDAADEPASNLFQRVLKHRKEYAADRKIRGDKIPSLPDADLSLPSCWELAALGQIAIVIDPNPSHRYPSYDGGTVPLLSTREFSGEYDWAPETAQLTTEEFWLFQKEFCDFAPGDIIFARKGRLGLPRYLPSLAKFTFSHTLFLVKPMDGLLPSYLLLHLRRDETVEWLMQEMNQNTGVPTLGKAKMEHLPIALPPLAEQRRIVTKVDELMALCDELEASLTTGEQVRSRLLESVLHHALEPA